MTWTDWACLGIFVLGFVLFLIGANIYNAIIGYSGIYLFIGAIAAYLVHLFERVFANENSNRALK